MKSKLLSVLVNKLQVIFWLLYCPSLIWEIHLLFLIVLQNFTVVNPINKAEKFKYSFLLYFLPSALNVVCFLICCSLIALP